MKRIYDISYTETKEQLNDLLSKPFKVPQKITKQALIYHQQLGLNKQNLKLNDNQISVRSKNNMIKKNFNQPKTISLKKKKLEQQYHQDQQQCSSRSRWSCKSKFNACTTYNSETKKGVLNLEKCHFDPKLQQQLIESLEFECQDRHCQCKDLERPYKKSYRSRIYCSQYPDQWLTYLDLAGIYHLRHLFKLDIILDRLPYSFKLFLGKSIKKIGINQKLMTYLNHFLIILPIIYQISLDFYYQLETKSFKQVIKDYLADLEINWYLIPLMVFELILNEVCHQKLKSIKIGGGFLVHKIKTPEYKNLVKNIMILIYKQKKAFLEGYLGANEEIFFRSTLFKLMDQLKPLFEHFITKTFNQLIKEDSNSQQKINTIYLILSSCLSATFFGLSHLRNLYHFKHNYIEIYCQVICAIVLGIIFSVIKHYQNLWSVWSIHFLHNFVGFQLK